MIECSGRTQVRRPSPQRIDFGHGNVRITTGSISESTLDRGPARLLDQREIEVALLRVFLDGGLVDRGEPRALEEALDRARRSADARPFLLFLEIGLARGEALHHQGEPARRRERLRALVDETRIDQPPGDDRLQILRRPRLHARGDFLGEQLEQKIGHG